MLSVGGNRWRRIIGGGISSLSSRTVKTMRTKKNNIFGRLNYFYLPVCVPVEDRLVSRFNWFSLVYKESK